MGGPAAGRRLHPRPAGPRLRGGAAPAVLRRPLVAPLPFAPARLRPRVGGDARRCAHVLAAAAGRLPPAAAGLPGPPQWLVAGARDRLLGRAAVVAHRLGDEIG